MKKKLLGDLFDESKRNNTILSIYDNKNETEKFYAGYIVEIFDDSILMHSFNENGEGDGYLLIRKVDIFKIEWESIYLNNLNFLVKQNDHIYDEQHNKFRREGINGISEIISICKEYKILLTIKLIYEDYITGYIVEEDDEYFIVEIYSTDGMRNGYNLIEYRDIQNLHFEGKEEYNLVKLLNRKPCLSQNDATAFGEVSELRRSRS